MTSNELHSTLQACSPLRLKQTSRISTPATQKSHKSHKSQYSQQSPLVCHACCFQIHNKESQSSPHKHHCEFNHNKQTFNIRNVQFQTQGGNGTSQASAKCQRCSQSKTPTQYCIQCKRTLCVVCSQQLHEKGKFMQHVRLPSQPQRLFSVIQEQELNANAIMRQSKRQNRQNLDYVSKGLERMGKSRYSVKRQKSECKRKNQQENMVPKHQHRHTERPSLDKKNKVQNGWFNCSRHGKKRSILTENYQLICPICYQQTKETTTKLREIDVYSLKSQEKLQRIQFIQGTISQVGFRKDTLEADFANYRQRLTTDYQSKQKLLEQRYNLNINNLQKWHKVYQSNLQNILSKCHKTIKQQQILTKSIQNKPQDSIKTLANLKSLLSAEEIGKLSKQYVNSTENYQFKVNLLKDQDFEQYLKNYSFNRKAVQTMNSSKNIDSSLNKMRQSAQLRQSRVSTSSMKTDRKQIKRQQSVSKCSYYDLTDHNLIKRSVCRDVSQMMPQKALFATSDRKPKKQKMDCSSKNKLIFFSNLFENYGKNPSKNNKQNSEMHGLALKEVKFINVEDVMAQTHDPNIRAISCSQAVTQQSQCVYMETQQSVSSGFTAPVVKLKTQCSKMEEIPNARMIQSVIMGQPSPILSNNNLTASISTKTKRKSDYLQMRDRLRKPNLMNKLK